MASFEMPVIVRFSKQELAGMTGRPVTDPAVERLGGLNIVLRPIGAPPEAGDPAPGNKEMAAAMRDLKAVLQPIESALFARLRSSSALARKFARDPLATLDELQLLDAAARKKVQGYAKVLAPLFAVK